MHVKSPFGNIEYRTCLCMTVPISILPVPYHSLLSVATPLSMRSVSHTGYDPDPGYDYRHNFFYENSWAPSCIHCSIYYTWQQAIRTWYEKFCKSTVMKWQWKQLYGWGHHNMRSYIKGHSLGKLEIHWPRLSLLFRALAQVTQFLALALRQGIAM